MAKKPTPEQAAKRILWVMVRKFGVRENEILPYGSFITAFPGGPFRLDDFNSGAEDAVSRNWVEPAKMGSLPALRLTAAGFAAAPEVEPEIETLQTQALRLLAAIYDRTRDTDQPVFVAELAAALELTNDEANGAWQYLREKGLIQTFSIPYTARIKASGADAIESGRKHPDRPLPGFGPVTYQTVYVNEMTGGTITQHANAQPKSPPPSNPKKSLRFLVWGGITVIATLFGVLAGIDYLFGRPWPTDPEIHPLEFVSGSPLTHLFKVQNRSAFDMNAVEFTCGVDLVYFKDAKGQTGGASDIAFVTGTFSIASGQWINYGCDASSLVEVGPDGSLSLRRSLSTKPAGWQSPLSILKCAFGSEGNIDLLAAIGPLGL